MKNLIFVWLWVLILCSVQGVAQNTVKQPTKTHGRSFATSQALAKGGIGIITTKLYIVTRSAANELILKPAGATENRWRGKSSTEPEIVAIFDGKVWSLGDVPEHFDLSKSIVISFERSRVRFFNFELMSGAYYDRTIE